MKMPIEVGESTKIKPGISSYASDLSKVSDLDILLDQARLNLEGEGIKVNDVPFYLGATAGMRVLSVEDRETIMTQIRDFIRGAGFRVDEDHWIRILTGEEEGVFGWLQVNWSLQTLDPEHRTKDPVGVLDLGGASTQITFMPNIDIVSNVFPVDVAGEDWRLYTQSFLYFGIFEALQRYEQKVESLGLPDPCYPIDEVNELGMPGSSDPELCKKYVASILPTDVQCFQGDGEECSMNGVYQPDLSKVSR